MSLCRYVSFVEIFMQKGVAALQEGGWGEPGYRWGTLLFFGGMVLTGILDLIVHFVSVCAGTQQPVGTNASAALPAEVRQAESQKEGSGGDSATEIASKTPEQLEAGSAPESVASEPAEPEIQAVEEVRRTVMLAAMLHA